MAQPPTPSMSIVKNERLSDPYITAGDRAYVIGAQTGGFPDMGSHVPGEMGGIWTHPLKLLDGFWLSIDGAWLPDATRFVSGPFWSAHDYDLTNGLSIRRTQFAPDGERALVVRYALRSTTTRSITLRLLARSDLRGVWLSEESGIHRGYDHAAYRDDLDAWLCHEDLHPWCAVVGVRSVVPIGHESGRDLWGPEKTAGRGVSVALDYTVTLPAGVEAVVEVVAAGSDAGPMVAVESFEKVRDHIDALWAAKEERYAALLTQSTLTVPDAVIGAAWDWVKCNYDWLLLDIPPLGRGLGAGAPEYMWWFGCDNAYALLGCLALGQHQTAVDTLDLLRTLSVASNGESGRVLHEANTRGTVYNPGNTQETPQYTTTVWKTFLWTGDLDFLRRAYPFCRRGLLEWTLGDCCPDGDVLPYGYGLIEVEGLNLQCIDVAAATVSALDALASMAAIWNDQATVVRCRDLAEHVRARIDEAFWIEDEGLYGDMRATPEEIIPRLRDWIDRAEQPNWTGYAYPEEVEALRHLLREAEAAPEKDYKRAWLFRNWSILSPLEERIAPPAQARRVLDAMETDRFTGRWGLYLNGDERSTVMSVSTGALISCALNYHRPDLALRLLRTLTETLPLHMPGAISELSPDRGCFVQAWSGSALAWPVVAAMFGVKPDAYHRRLVLEPVFPAEWPSARLAGLRIGSNVVDLDWDGVALTVTTREDDWIVTSDTIPLYVVVKKEDDRP